VFIAYESVIIKVKLLRIFIIISKNIRTTELVISNNIFLAWLIGNFIL